jgi:Protein of unknown function (DUF3309)
MIMLLCVLIVLLLAGGPYTGWHNWGWGPSGLIGVVLVIVLVLLLLGRL